MKMMMWWRFMMIWNKIFHKTTQVQFFLLTFWQQKVTKTLKSTRPQGTAARHTPKIFTQFL
ncbi:MAG: hypothetical protein ACD_7C00086G0005 [uncultured bacterium]|nr:MAG: hypothetical protein ACD_7C00086G0005 [uncultured bacterium]